MANLVAGGLTATPSDPIVGEHVKIALSVTNQSPHVAGRSARVLDLVADPLGPKTE
jgi:hypothetical protein